MRQLPRAVALEWRYFKNGAALLELALVQWAVHEAVQRGFQPFIPPDLVRAPVVAGCGFAPRDDEATQRLDLSRALEASP